jgi:hypothetical protein
MPEGKDTPATFDETAFVSNVNAGRAFGTNGPFIRVEARNSAGQTGGLGDVLATSDGPVTFTITVEHADWMRIDRLEMFMNVDSVVTAPGAYDTTPIPPTASYPIEFEEEDIELVAEGTQAHRRYRKVIEVEVETDVDAYVVFVVQGADVPPIYSAVLGRSVRAFAFTNPVYLDADGGGYDNPHLAELAAGSTTRAFEKADRVVVNPDALTPADISKIMHELTCSH